MQLFGNFGGGCGSAPQKEDLNHGYAYVGFSSKPDDEKYDTMSSNVINLNIFKQPVAKTEEEIVKHDYSIQLKEEFAALATYLANEYGGDAKAYEVKLAAKFNKEMIKVSIYNPYCWKDVKYTAQALVLAASEISAQYYHGIVKFKEVELIDVYGEGTKKTVSLPNAVADLNNATDDVVVENNQDMLKDLFRAVLFAVFPEVKKILDAAG